MSSLIVRNHLLLMISPDPNCWCVTCVSNQCSAMSSATSHLWPILFTKKLQNGIICISECICFQNQHSDFVITKALCFCIWLIERFYWGPSIECYMMISRHMMTDWTLFWQWRPLVYCPLPTPPNIIHQMSLTTNTTFSIFWSVVSHLHSLTTIYKGYWYWSSVVWLVYGEIKSNLVVTTRDTSSLLDWDQNWWRIATRNINVSDFL